jgi:beta-glucuronidase
MRLVVGLVVVLLAVPLGSCAPAAHAGSLPPTLTLEDHGGAQVAMQGSIPVPSFELQLRQAISLAGPWRVQRETFDTDLSLTDRATSLSLIEAEAEGRQSAAFDDEAWETAVVPGALNPPPRDRQETGAWYRRQFFVPAAWTGQAATLKAEAINYLADVWVNGTWAGYHEGGYTPFAMDLSALLVPDTWNVIAIRVDNPRWGTRNDIVPWGLTDWWNYGGITRPIRIEATPPLHVVRADVTPHLDGADVSVVIRRAATVVTAPEEAVTSDSPSASVSAASVPAASPPTSSPAEAAGAPAQATLQVEVMPALVTPDNVQNPLAVALVAPGRLPLISQSQDVEPLGDGDVRRLDAGFLMGDADLWTPARPALYVLQVSLDAGDGSVDTLTTSFGLRHITVDEANPTLLLNGTPASFSGVGLHDERVDPVDAPAPLDVGAHRITDTSDLMTQLDHARQVNADLIRSGHAPANPLLLMLADRLGFAIWEEIPLYHYTPVTYEIAMGRGIPQQMLREMALRDMNHPSVLFHGLSNESTGQEEREAALQELHDVDRDIDGTRLTGQASYGFFPDDPSQGPLDVAGYTLYYGVFYGTDPVSDTARALGAAHAAYPSKPIMVLEFGRWVDDVPGARQAQIFQRTYPVLSARRGMLGSGYVGGAVWWTLEDFTTMSPGIALERFGLFRPNGTGRPAADVAAELFTAAAGGGDAQGIESDARRVATSTPSGNEFWLLVLVGYALLTSVGTMAVILVVLVRRGGGATPRRAASS